MTQGHWGQIGEFEKQALVWFVKKYIVIGSEWICKKQEF